MGRQADAVFLQVFSPPGPERVYRDPEEPRGARRLRGHPRSRQAPSAPAGAQAGGRAPPDEAPRPTMPGGKGTRAHPARREGHRQHGHGPVGARVRRRAPRCPRHEHAGRQRDALRLSGRRQADGRQRDACPSAPSTRHPHPRRPAPRRQDSRRRADHRPSRSTRPPGPSSASARARAPDGTTDSQMKKDDHEFRADEEQLVLQKTVRDFCAREIIPNARALGRGGALPRRGHSPPWPSWACSACRSPRSYGGAGMKFHDYVVALEEVARADGSLGLTMASHNSLCTGHIYLAGNEAQKQQVPAARWPRQGAGRLGADRAGLGLGRRRGRAPARRSGRGRRAGCSTAPRPSSPRARWPGSTSSWPPPAPRRSRRG